MKISTSKLAGLELDWAVAKCEYGLTSVGSFLDGVVAHPNYSMYLPSLNWAQGGPIIEREGIDLFTARNQDGQAARWIAYITNSETSYGYFSADGTTPLEAAMRCYCCATLGDEVEVPEKIFSQP